MCSDHFAPWSLAQGQSGFAWSWLGSALQATRLDFGTVNAPGQRYHPAIIAQAAATLSEMYAGRFWLALGSGEALNEHITGGPWPHKAQRRIRLLESVQVMRALFAGELVTHTGAVSVHEARLYTRPRQAPALFGAAVSAEAARWVGRWADGLITIARDEAGLREVVRNFREGGGNGKPMFLQAAISFEATDDAALAEAHANWRSNVVASSDFNADTRLPELFDAATAFVRPEDMRDRVRISADPGRHRAWLESDFEIGFERVYVHHVGTDQPRFIEAFARTVLPFVQRRR
jgi:coenzyme F420-dependent glucose-6-phosphate dehydrogenase